MEVTCSKPCAGVRDGGRELEYRWGFKYTSRVLCVSLGVFLCPLFSWEIGR